MIQPGLVRTPFYDILSFTPGSDATQAIEPEDIAETISDILRMRAGTICDEIILSPHKKVIEKKIDPYILNFVIYKFFLIIYYC